MNRHKAIGHYKKFRDEMVLKQANVDDGSSQTPEPEEDYQESFEGDEQ